MITDVVQYFRDGLEAIGFEEWAGGFSFENIPADILDGSFHVDGAMKGSVKSVSNGAVAIEVEIKIRIFRKEFAEPINLLNQCLADLDSVIKKLVDSKNRITGVVKNVELRGFELSKLNDKNDNDSILSIDFAALTFIAV